MNRLLVALVLVSPAGHAQGTAWIDMDPAGTPSFRQSIDLFGDFDGDGCADILLGYSPNRFGSYGETRILSGRDGSLLFPTSLPANQAMLGFVHEAGDVDGDGHPDLALIRGPATTPITHRLEVWSPFLGSQLWFTSPHSQYYGGTSLRSQVAGNIDVDGDGRSEIVVLSADSLESDVYVYNSNGSLRYLLPALAYGWIANSVAAMPDLDGDGGDDFVVGAHVPGSHGAVWVISGRTGSLIRITPDIQPDDVLSSAVCDAGDMDLDGVHDYAAASYPSAPGTRIAVFSGRTGAVIHSWGDYGTDRDGMTGNVDCDLDGVPDLVVGAAGYQVSPVHFGQVRCYSGRDGSVLWNLSTTDNNDPVRPGTMIALGPQPGSPYPVVAWLHRNWAGQGRIVALHTELLGAGAVQGVAASSTSNLPLIGMRKVQNGSANNIRIHSAGGPPGAIAWLLLAGAGDTAVSGATIPLALDPLGLTGLTLYVPPVLTATTLLGSAGGSGMDAGFGAIDLPIPALEPNGIPFAAQWLLLDPPTGAFAATARHEFRAR
ncbi:MAG: FG-GAP repeat domain-containing protein [Planctomycetota bacterium]